MQMTEDFLANYPNSENFIPGIYNYCDRWCERCPFTDRCMNYAMEKRRWGDNPPRDIQDPEFGDAFTEIMEETLTLLARMAEEMGIDLDDVDEEALAEENRRFEESWQHDLMQAANAYAEMVDQWFDDAEGDFRDKVETLNMLLRVNAPGVDPQAEAAALIDAVEVIRWYQFFISAKLHRALMGRDDPETGYPKDADGSAKIALIAMDRSMAAWERLLYAFPARETETLTILARLQRLRAQTEALFPNARAFIRPGFDET